MLRRELVSARDDLSATIEQLELSNEELKSSNEELLSMNEELQSANEELQTSKEEYQSTNEELETVNAEVRVKVEELNGINADLQNLLASGQVPTVFLDRGLNIKRFTPGAKEVFRLADDDVGRPIDDVKTRFVDVDLDDLCRQVLDELGRHESEVRRPARESNPKAIFLMRISPYRTLDDQIEGVVLTFTDVTDLRNATNEAEERRRQLDLALASAKLGTWQRNVVDDRVHYDERAREILGMGETANLAPAIERVPQEERAQVEQSLQGALDPHGSGRYVVEHRWLMPDESIRWIQAAGLTRFRQVENTRVPVSQLGIVADINGVSVEETLGRTLRDVIPAMFSSVEPFYRRVLDKGESVLNIEVEGETPKQPGVRRSFVVSYLPLRSGDGVDIEEDGVIERVSKIADMKSAEASRVTGVNVVVHEITARKKIEEELRVARDSAQAVVEEVVLAKQTAVEAVRTKDRFLAALSHELRTPLTPVLAAASVPAGDDPAAAYEELSDLVRRNIGLEVRLIDDLLDMTRIDRDKLNVDQNPIEAAKVIGRAIAIVRPQAEEKDITLTATLPPGLPSANADAARLMQVIWNLVGNAIKFTEPGGRVQVTLTAYKPSPDRSPNLRIRVIDTGRGIDPELLPRVFDAFEQGAQDDRTGLGLGPAISRSIVELHGGDISVESGGLGHGATFGFTLPTTTRKPERADPSSGVSAEDPASVPPILLVEDHIDTGRVLATLLEDRGLEVTLATSVTNAAEAFDPQKHRLLVSDIGLPDGTGLDLLAILHERAPDLRAIALSGYGSDDEVAASSGAGFSEHITKPVELDELFGAIQRLAAGAAGG